MTELLRATLDDVPVLDGYLHDASFVPNDLEFDADAKTLKLPLERICYEKPERGKALFIFPVIRLPWIESLLTVTNVQDVVWEWKRGRDQHRDDGHMLLGLVHKKDLLELRSPILLVTGRVSPDTRILLEDTSGPSVKRRVTDFGRTVFQAMDEIDRLRVRADRQP